MAIGSIFAQGEQLIPPHSWGLAEGQLPVVSVYELETLDHELLLAEDTRIEEIQGRTNNGRLLFEQVDPSTVGVWTEFDDGSKLWQFKYRTAGAIATSVYFNNYHIPVGGQLHLWSEDKSYFVGPYDHTENNEHGRHALSEVFGDIAVLEYYQPAGVVGELALETRGFAHFYRYIEDLRDEWSRGSDDCEVDVNCPEGHGWEGPRDGAVRLRIVDGEFLGLCSGSMVNTTALDCRRYCLTAYHCTVGVSDDDLLLLQVRFNYDRSGCGSGAAPGSHQRTGVFDLSNSNDGGGNSGSDYHLIEVEDELLSSWPIFYAGWDAGGSGASFGKSIHHPSGDSKKISQFGSALISDNWGFASNTHWRVIWQQTVSGHGVTEGGSSGSPIYGPSKRILGTLTGGSSCCQGFEDPNNGCIGQNSPDWYGKMSYHWDGNSNPSGGDLKEWLDPINSGATTVFGAYKEDCSIEWVGVEEIEFSDLGVYPNPATSEVTYDLSNNFDLQLVSIYNSQGQLVKQVSTTQNFGQIQVQSFAEGLYFLTFTTKSGQQTTRQFTVVR
jgi:V8-like Glu-specific endopeptidase